MQEINRLATSSYPGTATWKKKLKPPSYFSHPTILCNMYFNLVLFVLKDLETKKCKSDLDRSVTVQES